MDNAQGPVAGVILTATSTTDDFGVGTTVHREGTDYVWCKGTGTIAAKENVKISGLGTFVVAASGNAGHVFGIVLAALTGNLYGWVAVRGYVADATVATSVASGDLLSLITDSAGDLVTAAAVAESGSTAHAIGAQTVRAIALEDDTAGVGDVFLL